MENEQNLMKQTQDTEQKPHFGPVWPDLGPGHFFFENPSSSLF